MRAVLIEVTPLSVLDVVTTRSLFQCKELVFIGSKDNLFLSCYY